MNISKLASSLLMPSKPNTHEQNRDRTNFVIDILNRVMLFMLPKTKQRGYVVTEMQKRINYYNKSVLAGKQSKAHQFKGAKLEDGRHRFYKDNGKYIDREKI